MISERSKQKTRTYYSIHFFLYKFLSYFRYDQIVCFTTICFITATLYSLSHRRLEISCNEEIQNINHFYMFDKSSFQSSRYLRKTTAANFAINLQKSQSFYFSSIFRIREYSSQTVGVVKKTSNKCLIIFFVSNVPISLLEENN